VAAKPTLKTKLELPGTDDVAEFLRTVPKRVAKKALKQAVTAGATPLAKAARKEAPKKHGLLKSAVTKKVKVYPDGNAIALVGANRDTSETIDGRRHVPALYLHLIVGGTKPHPQKHYVRALELTVKQHPGTKPNPFLERAFEQTAPEIKARMEDKLAEVVAKEMAKGAA
jgi:HK97 gp10 family phage protein